MKNRLVSFVLPAFKSEYLRQAIESILNQTYSYWELIIVDDASPEPISELVNSYKDIRIKYFRNKINIGRDNLIRNWNYCVGLAYGEYVVLASDDDIYNCTFLENMINLIEKYPTVDIIRAGVERVDESNNIIDKDYSSKEILSVSDFVFLWSKGFISCIGNYIFNKDKLIKNGGFVDFPKAHYSDDATALLMAKHGIACTNKNLFYFRTSINNLSNIKDEKVVKSQFHATQQFIKWLFLYISSLPDDKHFFSYKCRAFENYRKRYIIMLEQLSEKLPFSSIGFVLNNLRKDKYLYNKEKIILIFKYLIFKM